jgi:hypothetical protein
MLQKKKLTKKVLKDVTLENYAEALKVCLHVAFRFGVSKFK